MILLESNEKAINLYNRLSGTQNGKSFISNLIHYGFSSHDLIWAVNMILSEGIPEYSLIIDYRQWKEYAVPYFRDSQGKHQTILPSTHEQMIKEIDDALNYYQHLNEIYNDGTTAIIAIKTFRHASLLPSEIKRSWCICKQEFRFKEFFPQSEAYLLITNKSLLSPYKNVIAIVNGDYTEYWDSNNQRMSEISDEEEDRLVKYERMLKPKVVKIINTFKINESWNRCEDYKTIKYGKRIYYINESKLLAIRARHVRCDLNEKARFDIENSDKSNISEQNHSNVPYAENNNFVILSGKQKSMQTSEEKSASVIAKSISEATENQQGTTDTNVVQLNDTEHSSAVELMKGFMDNGKPKLGIFWYNYSDNSLFGVEKGDADLYIEDDSKIVTYPKLHKTYWQKQHYRALARKDTSSIFYNEHDYTQIPRGRIFGENDKFYVNVGSWINGYINGVRCIDKDKLRELLIDEFNLPEDFQFRQDKHWDIGHGWSEEQI